MNKVFGLAEKILYNPWLYWPAIIIAACGGILFIEGIAHNFNSANINPKASQNQEIPLSPNTANVIQLLGINNLNAVENGSQVFSGDDSAHFTATTQGVYYFLSADGSFGSINITIPPHLQDRFDLGIAISPELQQHLMVKDPGNTLETQIKSDTRKQNGLWDTGEVFINGVVWKYYIDGDDSVRETFEDLPDGHLVPLIIEIP